ncbi:Secretory phospholipase A2 receptor [Oopsacas minuta]|uniref:Secretory phospholipase A2 receptor n=2 Tax=Oopsacas minuta TaxID=111878 RepID=A0AAV7KBA4_9METZ|nr:Secretory phospholipase A2 receptor [Oopsacas minuta]
MYTVALLKSGIYQVDPFGEDVINSFFQALSDNTILTTSQTIYCLASTEDTLRFNWVYINADGIATTLPHVMGTSKGVSALYINTANPGSYSCEATLNDGTKSIYTVILAPTLYTDPIIGCDAITDNGNCYRYIYIASGLSFSDAQSSCEANGGDLASIFSSREDNLLRSLVPNSDTNCWIGLENFDADAAQHAWIDGTPVEYHDFDLNSCRRRRGLELDEPVRYRRTIVDCLSIAVRGTWRTGSCTSTKSCYFCTNKVSQFGQLIEPNQYTSLSDNAILTASTTLHCITEPLGNSQVIWSYVGLDGTTSKTFDVATDATTGCEVTQFRGEDRKKYTTALLNPYITTVISAGDTRYYTHGLDKDGILLFCKSFDHSVTFGNIAWRTASSVEYPNPLDVSNIPSDFYMIDCIDKSTGNKLFTVDLRIQGPPVGTIQELNIETFSLPPPLLNKAYVPYSITRIDLSINVMYTNMGWKGPVTESSDSNLRVTGFASVDMGEYYFYAINWDKEQQLALRILIEVYSLGIFQGGSIFYLEENSIVENSGRLNCADYDQSKITWWFSVFQPNNPQVVESDTGTSQLTLGHLPAGLLYCEIRERGAYASTYHHLVLNDPSLTVVEESNSYIFTRDQQSELLLCHKADNSLNSAFLIWREVGQTKLYVNPLSTNDIQIYRRYLMECIDAVTNETILTIDLLLQGPVLITLYDGFYESAISTSASLNYRAQDVVLSANVVGRWMKPDQTYVEDSSITFSTFELSDVGMYTFSIPNWDLNSGYTGDSTIEFTVYQAGLLITANTYEELPNYSVIPASTTLYCIDTVDNEVEWQYEDLAGTITNIESFTESETGVSLLSVSIDEPGFYRCTLDTISNKYIHTTVILNTSIYTIVQQVGQLFTYTIGIDAASTSLICVGEGSRIFIDTDSTEELSNPLEVRSIPNDGNTRTIQCRDTDIDSKIFSFYLFIQGPPVITLDAGTSDNYELLSPEINSAYVNLKSPNVGLHVNIPGRWQRPDEIFVEDISIIFPVFDLTYEGLYKFYVINWDNEETLAMQILITVYPFGERIDENTYRAIFEKNSYLTASTTLYCKGATDLAFVAIGSDSQTPIDSGSEVSIFDAESPGLYICSSTETYQIPLIDESIHTPIQASNSYTYTRDVDRNDASLVCITPDNSDPFFQFWVDIEGNMISNSYYLNVDGLEDGINLLICISSSSTNTIALTADIFIQGPPEITLNTGTVESYNSLTPGDNTASINLQAQNVVLATNLAGRWQRPNGTFVEDDSITFPTFEISDQGVYKYYVNNWDKMETLAIQIQLSVFTFGEEMASNVYEYLSDLSVLTTNTTLYCITEKIDIPEVIWNYEDLQGVRISLSADTDFFTGFSSLLVTTDKSGYYSCDVTENGINKTYTIAVMNPYVYTVVEVTDSYSYTVGIDKEVAFLFCHSSGNSIPFQDYGWRELGSTVRTQNPLDIADIPDDGNTHAMGCFESLENSEIFLVNVIIQGPLVITLDTGNVVSFSQVFPYINTVYVNHQESLVRLEANVEGTWSWPAGTNAARTLDVSSFQISIQGLYTFYIDNWEKESVAAMQILITSHQFGERIDLTNYNRLEANSILTSNTDLYCINGVATWSYTDLAGICEPKSGTIDATGASVLSAGLDNPGYYSCEVIQDDVSNTYTVAVLDTTLLQVIETSESYQYTIGVDNEDIFLFCHKPDNSISSSDIVWMKNDSFARFKNPLDVFAVGNLFKYTDTYLIECLDQTSENILSAEISMQGPPVISVDTGTVRSFESLTSGGNTAYIIEETRNVVMTANLVGKWQRPDDTHVSDNSITFLSFDESDVGVYKFYVTDWYNEQKLAIQIQLSLSATYLQSVTDLSTATSSESSILVTWSLLSEQTTLSDEKFSIYYGYEDVEYFAGTTDKLYFNINGLTLNFNYTIRVDLQFAYSTETYSETVHHFLIIPDITEPTTILQLFTNNVYAQEGVLIAVIVFLLLVIAAILAVAIIAVFCIKRYLTRNSDKSQI